jgi:hypothetical protein
MAFATKYDQIKRDLEAEKLAEKKIKRQSIIDSLIVMAIFIAILVIIKLPPQYPPTPEAAGGMEIITGDNLEGMTDPRGLAMTGTPLEQVSHSEPAPEQPQTQAPVSDPNDPDAILKTHPETKTPVIKPVDPNINKNTPKTPPNKEPERQPNQNALFHKSTLPGHNGPGGNGVTQGTGNKPGTQGDPNGNPKGGFNHGHGTRPGNGDGNNFVLDGREKISLPAPQYNSQMEGIDIVQIVVDKNGNVIDAHGGYRHSTFTDPNGVAQDEIAARKAKFSASQSAGDRQIGYIYYNHKLQ